MSRSTRPAAPLSPPGRKAGGVARAWWRGLGLVLAALVLGVMTLGPALDGIICKDDAGMSAAAAEHGSQSVSEADHQPDDGKAAASVCVHAHCHHGAPSLPVEHVAIDVTYPFDGRRTPAHADLPLSAPQSGLDRPPRT